MKFTKAGIAKLTLEKGRHRLALIFEAVVIASLRWSEIDTDSKLITLAGERAKNGCSGDPTNLHDGTAIFGEGANGYPGWSGSKTRLDKATGINDSWTLGMRHRPWDGSHGSARPRHEAARRGLPSATLPLGQLILTV